MDGNGIEQTICLQQGYKPKNLLRGEEQKASELGWLALLKWPATEKRFHLSVSNVQEEGEERKGEGRKERDLQSQQTGKREQKPGCTGSATLVCVHTCLANKVIIV